MNSPVIKPTVGCKVWYRNNGSMQKLPRADGRVSHPEFCGIEQPMDATVIFVHGSRMVNLDITDHVGQRFVAASVPLLQDGDAIPDLGCYCEWMPYQTAQAKKEHVVRIEPESEKFGLVSTDSAIEQQIQAAGADKGIVLEPKYREPTQREQLEYALVSGAASHLAHVPAEAGNIAAGIKAVLDALHPEVVLNNPHTGTPRDPRDVASDPQAILCVKPGEPLKAAPINLPVIDPGPDALEREIQAAGADKAPRVTPAALKDEIVSEHYFTAADGVIGAAASQSKSENTVMAMVTFKECDAPSLGLLTFCVLVLRNGFTVHGVSACASPANFNAEIGRSIARENAEREIWPLLGFRLRDELARTVPTEADAAADLAGTPRPDNPTAEAADFLSSVKACDLSGDAPCEACQ